MKTNNLTKAFKPLTLAAALAFSTTAMTTFAEDATNTMDTTGVDTAPVSETYNTSWMTPLAAEFAALDTSGNGLLLPHEASKGKAFNKKTFAQADTDHDGYIDQNEYIYFKSGKRPDAIQPQNNLDTQGQSTLTNQEPSYAAAAESGTASNRSVGEVIDDSVITAKAKAKILATKELKSLQISVETRDGEVLLSGFVDNEAAKIRAEQVVSQIAGVKSVRNGLEIRG
jgi:hypothetical protein